MSKVLITGAKGAIGEVLVRKLESKGHDITVIDSNSARLEDKNYFEQITNPSEIDVVYHLAALSNVPDSWNNPSEFIEVNTFGTERVLEFCRENNAKLNFMSSYMYGKPEYLPIDEKHVLSVRNPYALSKKLAEDLVTFYGKHFDLEFNIVRPFNVYGSLKNRKLLIPEIIEQIIQEKKVKVMDLTPKRDYVFIDDLVNFLCNCNDKFCNGPVNIGSGKSHSVEEVVTSCIEVWGKNDLGYESNEVSRKNEIPETICDYAYAKKHFNWEPKFSFIEGLKKMKSED